MRAGRVRLLSARLITGGVIPEPTLLFSVRPAIGCADERVRFWVTFYPAGLFSRDRPEATCVSLHMVVGDQSQNCQARKAAGSAKNAAMNQTSAAPLTGKSDMPR